MKNLVDLTRTFSSQMRGIDIDPAMTLEKDGWNASMYHIYSHSGTHMDAPLHFGVNSTTIDHFPIEDCLGPAWVVSVEAVQPAALLTVVDLGKVANLFQPGESLLLRTGWSKFHHDRSTFRDGLPRISEELAHWCVSHQVKLLGVEPPSVADVNNLKEVTLIHQILLQGGIKIVEGLINLDLLEEAKVMFAAFPLKMEGGDGAPVRAMAWSL